jgi:peptidoglycan/xylan/chitin deacetylase (PgdA/CDA1 family)
LFLPTGVIDGTATFAWYQEQPPLLGWDEILELDRGGTLRFEAHTVTHPNLLLLDDDASRREIAQSKVDLEARLSRTVEGFCYPAGLFGERERAFVAEAGYRAAVSCEPGVNLPRADLLTLRRRQIDPRDRRLDFRAKVGGGHDTPLPLRGLYRRLRYGERPEADSAPAAAGA